MGYLRQYLVLNDAYTMKKGEHHAVTKRYNSARLP